MSITKVTVVLNIKNLAGSRISTFGSHILTSITGNANFGTPYPGLRFLSTGITNVNNAITAQVKGNKASTQAVKDAEYQLKRILKIFAAYVEWISNDNATIALSSGFSLRQATTRTVASFTAIHGLNIGEVDVKSKASKDASYIFQYTTTPLVSASWVTSATIKQVKHTISGLTPGVMYWFRVAVVTKAGQQPWSNAVNIMVV